MTLAEARREYRNVFNIPAPREFSIEDMQNKMQKHFDDAKMLEERKLKEEQDRIRHKEEMQNRADARGSWEVFTSYTTVVTDEDEQKVQNLAVQCKYDIENANAAIQKFMDAMRNDPMYALSWSKNVFSSAAEKKVAERVAHMILIGASHKQLMTEMQKEVNNRAKYIPSSTSATSNLAEQCELEAWASLLTKIL
jgi:hypothetical protein